MESKSFVSFQVEPITETTITTYDNKQDQNRPLKVRLDKWLWAARFFKTRALARIAIEQGKVLYNGQQTIPTKEIAVGAVVLINQGGGTKAMELQKLSTRRRSTEEAHELYNELEPSKHLKFLHSVNIHEPPKTNN